LGSETGSRCVRTSEGSLSGGAADQIFLELAREIESNGVGRKVAADMFGFALRTYQAKVQRLSESASERNRTLWQAIYQCVLDAGSISRQRIEEHFKRDPSADVAAVLHDLVQSRLGVIDAGRTYPAFGVKLRKIE
jgi:hypothetical protein